MSLVHSSFPVWQSIKTFPGGRTILRIWKLGFSAFHNLQTDSDVFWCRLAQLAGRPHKLIWPRIWSSKRVCWDSRDIRDKNAVNGVSSNIRSASHVSSYEAVFSEDYGLGIEDSRPRIEDRGLGGEDWGLRSEDWGLKTKDRGSRTEDWRLLPYQSIITSPSDTFHAIFKTSGQTAS